MGEKWELDWGKMSGGRKGGRLIVREKKLGKKQRG